MPEIALLDKLATGIETVNSLSHEVRRTVSGDVLFLFSLFSHDLASGRCKLVSVQDSSASRAVQEILKLDSQTHFSLAIERQIVFIDLTDEGFAADRTEFGETLASAEIAITFGLSVRGEKFSANLENLNILRMDSFPSCRFFAKSLESSPSVLTAIQDDATVKTILTPALTGLRRYSEEPAVLEARVEERLHGARKERELQERIVFLTLESAGLRDTAIGAEATVGTLQWKLERLNSHLNHLQSELQNARAARDSIIHSRTFRLGRVLTSPLRLLRKVARKLR